MVTKVFPPGELADRTLAFARRIASLPTVTALLIKDSVNSHHPPPAVIAVGALNAVGGVIALIVEWEGAAVGLGLVFGVVIVVLALASARATGETAQAPGPSLP
jgi:hypothetical protein